MSPTVMYFIPWTLVIILTIVVISLLRLKKWPRNPNYYDLRYIRPIYATDAWDGQSISETGVVHQHTLYREHCVHTCKLLETEEFQAKLNKPNDGFFPAMLNVAMAYRHIYQYLRLNTKSEQAEKLHARHAVVALSKSNQEMLENHWQYVEMKNRFATKFGTSFKLVRDEYLNTATIVLQDVD